MDAAGAPERPAGTVGDGRRVDSESVAIATNREFGLFLGVIVSTGTRAINPFGL